MSTRLQVLLAHGFLAHQGRGFKSPIHPSRGQLLCAKMLSYERRGLATLEGIDGVSEVIKLVIKLCNRQGAEGGGGCLEEFNFAAGLLVVVVQGVFWEIFFFF